VDLEAADKWISITPPLKRFGAAGAGDAEQEIRKAASRLSNSE
jgi:hypothetical protein